MLPYDVTRCNGDGCASRSDCARYLSRDDIGPRTPFYTKLGAWPCAMYLRAHPARQDIAPITQEV